MEYYMGYFPFFIDIENKQGLVVGGGKVAAEKISKLAPFHSYITVVAPSILKDLLHNQHIQCIQRKFLDDDICGKTYVIAATNDEPLNQYISDLCKAQGILVNVADDKDKCGFLFPSLVTSGSLCIGISTGGASPRIASIYREKIQKEIPANMEEILLYLTACRKWAKENIPDERERRLYLINEAEQCIRKLC